MANVIVKSPTYTLAYITSSTSVSIFSVKFCNCFNLILKCTFIFLLLLLNKFKYLYWKSHSALPCLYLFSFSRNIIFFYFNRVRSQNNILFPKSNSTWIIFLFEKSRSKWYSTFIKIETSLSLFFSSLLLHYSLQLIHKTTLRKLYWQNRNAPLRAFH